MLLAPLVNDDEERLIYIRQSASGAGSENTNFSVPEINDLKARVRSISQFGDFSTIDFTLIGLGEPRVVRAGVVSGSFFSVMGLRPVPAGQYAPMPGTRTPALTTRQLATHAAPAQPPLPLVADDPSTRPLTGYTLEEFS